MCFVYCVHAVQYVQKTCEDDDEGVEYIVLRFMYIARFRADNKRLHRNRICRVRVSSPSCSLSVSLSDSLLHRSPRKNTLYPPPWWRRRRCVRISVHFILRRRSLSRPAAAAAAAASHNDDIRRAVYTTERFYPGTPDRICQRATR